MLSFYRPILALATVLAAASCAAPDTAESSPEPVTDSAPPVEAEASSGGTSCTLSTTCWSGGIQGHCAKSTINGAAMCCTGCVDSQGYCQAGTAAGQCGGGGQSCDACPMGETCSAGACVTNCAEPGGYCTSNGSVGTYGNGQDGACSCCVGCWAVDGSCITGNDDLLCGHGGGWCQNCGGLTCIDGSCQ